MRMRRKFAVALAFVSLSLLRIIRHGGEILIQSLRSLPSDASAHDDFTRAAAARLAESRDTPRLGYVRPPGPREGLISIFDGISAELSDPNSRRRMELPRTARQIATKYGIPETSRDVVCSTNGTTTVGWIPSEGSYYNVSAMDDPWRSTGRIPDLIFQSWKTNQLTYELCEHVLVWSQMNPSYDFFLFDDGAADDFIRIEYGREIFAGYACVSVGAAMCDVWRLLVVYLFGGLYFDFDTRLNTELSKWNWGDRDVVTGRSCNAPRKHPGGCAHQWGLVYAPQHPVLSAAIRETLGNLAERKARHVYDISFWSYYNAWRNGPYNQSYMPGWGESFGGRVTFQNDDAKDVMVEGDTHWQKAKRIWREECL